MLWIGFFASTARVNETVARVVTAAKSFCGSYDSCLKSDGARVTVELTGVIRIVSPSARALATNPLAKARPDGLTILITPVSSTVNLAPSLFRQLSYDPQKDFAAVTTLATVSFTLAVDAKKPIHSIQELVAHLKAQPKQGFYGATSNAGVISGELFKSMAGLSTTYVPYKANPNALADLLAG